MVHPDPPPAGVRTRSKDRGSRVAGVILAAGLSRRMGAPKAGLRIDGETFIERIAGRLRDAGADPIVAVASLHMEVVRASLGGLFAPSGPVEVLLNPAPDRGQLASLKLAIQHLDRDRVDAALVALVDQPQVTLETYRRVAQAALESPTQTIVVPTHAGRRGHPVLFRREVWSELLATPDDAGARDVVRRDPSRVLLLQVDDDGILLDIDTPADLAALGSRAPR